MKASGYLVLCLAASVAIGLSACNQPNETSQPSANATASVVLLTHPGKLLASNCFQCHGTDGKNGAFDSLAGKSAAELIKEMNELKTKTDSEEAIMQIHALGYTDEQIKLIADYFSQVR